MKNETVIQSAIVPDEIKKTCELFKTKNNFNYFLNNISIQQKMELIKFVNEGIYKEFKFETIIELEKYMNERSEGVSVVLRFFENYVGVDTRGLVRVEFPFGKRINLYVLDKKLDNFLLSLYKNESEKGKNLRKLLNN